MCGVIALNVPDAALGMPHVDFDVARVGLTKLGTEGLTECSPGRQAGEKRQ